MADDGTLQRLAAALTRALQPLQARLAAGDARGLLAEMGLSLPPALDGLPAFASATNTAVTALEGLAAPATALATAVEADDVGAIVSATAALLQAIDAASSALDTVASALASVASSLSGINPAEVTAFAGTLAEKLLEHVIIDYLTGYWPVLLRVLALLGIANLDLVPPDPNDPAKVAYQRHDLNLANAGRLLSDPVGYLLGLYGWNTATLDAGALLSRFCDLLVDFGAVASYNPATSTLTILPFTIAPTTTASPPGLSAILGVGISDGAAITLPSLLPPGWTVQLIANGALDAGLELRILPPGQLELHATASVDGSLQVQLARTPDPGGRLTIIGIPGVATIDAASIKASVGGEFTWDLSSGVARGAFVIGASITGGKFTVKAANADGFIASLLSNLDIAVGFDLQLGWAGDRGFYVGSNVGTGTTISTHVSVGPFALDSLHLELTGSGNGLALETSATGSGTLGPIVASARRIGARMTIGFARGNLGLAQLDLTYKPPDGVALAISAPGVSGAGFVAFDAASARYLGVVALAVGDVSISAVGVLDTRLPGGATGYSLIIVASAGFPPVELGFGFSLTGIGGVVAVNRTADVPSLQALARAGQLDSLLFPADLAHRAPQVAASLAKVFPPLPGHFIVGPAVRVEWGTGGIVDAEVGVFIELSDSGGGISLLRVALLGWAHLRLPDAVGPVADITLDVLGVADLAAKTLSLDAGLRKSAIAGLPVTGQAALRASWGASPAFVLAIGGFNPHFAAPAGFPALARFTLSVGGNNPRLRLSAYLALTSNTVQLGCKADLYASAGPAAVSASLNFDALVQLKPFGLVVDLTVAATVLLGGSPVLSLRLDLHVTGPQPWIVTGSASFQVLCFSYSVPISITVGSAPPPQPPRAVDLDGNLGAALADLHSWQTGPPAGRGVVTVRSQAGARRAVHPLGSLTVRQHAAPLGQRIERYGPDLLDAACRYQITAATIGGVAAPAAGVTDFFAPAQFLTMTDAQKLSAPSFELMTAGTTLGSAELSLPATPGSGGAPATVADTYSARTWDVVMLDSPDPSTTGATAATTAPTSSTATLPGTLLAAQLAGAAAAVNGASGRGSARYAAPGSGIAVQQPSYAVVGLNLAAVAPGQEISAAIPTAAAAGSLEAGVSGRDWQVVCTSELP